MRTGRVLPRYVCIAMEALDQLLMACHCQSINLFVESFLKMVAKLLESEKPNLQILGTNSVSNWGAGYPGEDLGERGGKTSRAAPVSSLTLGTADCLRQDPFLCTQRGIAFFKI